MIEKRWKAIPSQSFTANGTTDGKITVANAAIFRVKQQVILTATSLPNLDGLEVKRVTDRNTLYVGPIAGNIDSRSDISAYTTVLSAAVFANEQLEQYTQTINGTPYTFVSDGTPTATEVVTGLKNLINADGPLPVTATGTTTLILTGDSAGYNFTHSPSANMSTVDNTVSPTAAQVVTGLITVINADGPLPITATGTVTLILTADVAGTPFTYADANANLTNVLTTANVVQVFYSGNWIASVIRSSTVTSINTGIPVVAGQWYKLKATALMGGTGVVFSVGDNDSTTMSTLQPTAALHYIFKLEKTLGIVARTTFIDYIAWRRDRG